MFTVIPTPLPPPRVADDARRSATLVSASDDHEPGGHVSGLRRIVYVALAVLFLTLATLGVVLPGLPTTPFMLLASYLLSRSSPRMHRLLLANRWFGPILSDWQQHRALKRRTKIQAICVIGAAIIGLAAFSSLPWPSLALVFALVLIGLVVIYRLPTIDTPTARGLRRRIAAQA